MGDNFNVCDTPAAAAAYQPLDSDLTAIAALTTPATSISGAAQKASNLSDLASASSARTNLGLGGAATLAVGTTAGTVAAGDDSRITGAVPKSTVTTAGDLIYGTGNAAVSRLGIGSALQVLRTNAGATAPEWATVSSGGVASGTPVPSGGIGSDDWFLPPGITENASMNITAWTRDVIWYIPFLVPAAITVTAGAVRTTTGAASSLARVGIVAADTTWQPSSLVYEFATFDTSATAVVTKTGLSVALAAGRYLIAFKTEVGNPSLAYNSFSVTGRPGRFGLSAGGSSVAVGTVATSAGAYANPPAAWANHVVGCCPFYMRWTA
jgi:hypothetical protein